MLQFLTLFDTEYAVENSCAVAARGLAVYYTQLAILTQSITGMCLQLYKTTYTGIIIWSYRVLQSIGEKFWPASVAAADQCLVMHCSYSTSLSYLINSLLLIVNIARNSSIHSYNCNADNKSYTFTVGNCKGRPVAILAACFTSLSCIGRVMNFLHVQYSHSSNFITSHAIHYLCMRLYIILCRCEIV